jgi:hypothetical protein
VDDYWTHVVHLALPAVPQGHMFVVTNNATGCDGECPEMQIVIQATRHLVTSMQAAISAMIDRVSDVLPQRITPRAASTHPSIRFSGGFLIMGVRNGHVEAGVGGQRYVKQGRNYGRDSGS